MMTKLRACTLCFALIFSMTACGDSGSSPTPDTTNNKEAGPNPDGPATDSGGGGDTTASAPTFGDIYTQVISPNCSCHLGTGHSTGLDMPDANTAFTNLVGAATGGSACSGKTRVVAGDSAQSVLYDKVTGGGNLCGSRMPLGGAALPQNLVDLVKAWIDGGAKQ